MTEHYLGFRRDRLFGVGEGGKEVWVADKLGESRA